MGVCQIRQSHLVRTKDFLACDTGERPVSRRRLALRLLRSRNQHSRRGMPDRDTEGCGESPAFCSIVGSEPSNLTTPRWVAGNSFVTRILWSCRRARVRLRRADQRNASKLEFVAFGEASSALVCRISDRLSRTTRRGLDHSIASKMRGRRLAKLEITYQ